MPHRPFLDPRPRLERATRVRPVLSGALATVGPLVFLLLSAADPAQSWATPAQGAALAGGTAIMVTLAGAMLLSVPRAAGILATLACLASLVLTLAPMMASPVLTLAVVIVAALTIELVWSTPSYAPSAPSLRASISWSRLRGSASVALVIWFIVVVGQVIPDSWALPGCAIALLICDAWIAVHLRRLAALDGTLTERRVILGGLVASVAGAALAWGNGPAMLTLGALGPVVGLVAARDPGRSVEERQGLVASLLHHPARALITTFLAFAVLGTVLLVLPAASASGRSIGIVDAAFTAVSAVCITGLVVLDTPTDFSGFGQGVILALIQVGGLGIMTYAMAIFGFLGRRLSLGHEMMAASLVGGEDRGRLAHALRRLFAVTVVAEGVGAVVLTVLFVSHGDTGGGALWRGVFTAVSAFCNAGFSLQTTSMVNYQGSAPVIHTVAALIVLGGLAPLGIIGLVGWMRGRRLPAQSKIVLATSGWLLASGAVLLGFIERDGVLADLSFWDRVHNAWFQSVTARTAGFNSVEISSLHPAALTVLMTLMFIGGSPGGTAGGIKTTTAAVLLLSVVAATRGAREASAFGVRITHHSFYKAAAVATAGLASIVAGMLAMLLTQPIPPFSVVFEVISALGTVGLSTGATGQLDGVGKVIIMVCMFVGRVGPLTMFVFVSDRQPTRLVTGPAELVDVG